MFISDPTTNNGGVEVETPPAEGEVVEIAYKVPTKIEAPRPNRAQRRLKAKQDRREEQAKLRAAFLRSAEALMADIARTHKRCPRCGLHYLSNSWYRCQCQVEQRRQCATCDKAFMSSQQYWRENNICTDCLEQWDSDVASWSAAYDAYYERRAWDDEQHRLAQEERECKEASADTVMTAFHKVAPRYAGLYQRLAEEKQ